MYEKLTLESFTYSKIIYYFKKNFVQICSTMFLLGSSTKVKIELRKTVQICSTMFLLGISTKVKIEKIEWIRYICLRNSFYLEMLYTE
jgi:hypothetical protein